MAFCRRAALSSLASALGNAPHLRFVGASSSSSRHRPRQARIGFATEGGGPSTDGGKTPAITRSGELVAQIGDVAKKGAAELTVAPVEREC